MGLGFRVHAHSGVPDGQHDVFPRDYWSVQASILLIERDVRGLDGELTAVRHGIPCIHREVHNYLLDLTRIGFHRANLPTIQGQINILTDYAGEHLEVLGDDGIQIHYFGRQQLLAAEGKPALAISWTGPRSAGSEPMRSSRNSQ